MASVPLPKNSMLVAREDGQLFQVDFTEFPNLNSPGLVDWDLSVSKLLISKIQLTRSRFVTIDEMTFENIVRTGQTPSGATGDLEITLYNTLDGKNVAAEHFPSVMTEDDGFIHLDTRVTGQNFAVQLRGTYNINTMTVTLHQNGRR